MPGSDTPGFFTMIKDNQQLILLAIPAPYTGVHNPFNPVIFCSYSSIEAFFLVPEKKVPRGCTRTISFSQANQFAVPEKNASAHAIKKG